MAIVNSFNFGNERGVGMGVVSVRVQYEFYTIIYFFGGYVAVMGKHPDLMVAHPTSTIFPTIGRNFEIS